MRRSGPKRSRGEPSYRARLFRMVLKHSVGRKLRSAELSVADMREMEGLMVRSQRLPKGTEVEPVTVDGVRAEWVVGPGARDDAAILYLHGGGSVMGSPATHRELAACISMAGRAPVLSLDYRLAPEFAFPAALDDAKTAYAWLLARPFASRRLVIGGDSSGGGLALQTLLSLRDEGVALPCAGFFMSPVTDWTETGGESFRTRAELDPMISAEQCRRTAALYVGHRSDQSPLLRPVEMGLNGLPPLWIQVGDHEVLLSDAERLAKRAAQDGVDVDFKVWPGMWHVFQNAPRFVPEARQSLDELSLFLGERIEG